MYIKCPYKIKNQVYKFRGDLTQKKKKSNIDPCYKLHMANLDRTH